MFMVSNHVLERPRFLQKQLKFTEGKIDLGHFRYTNLWVPNLSSDTFGSAKLLMLQEQSVAQYPAFMKPNTNWSM